MQLCPRIKKILDTRITQSRKWRAAWDGESKYQVKYNTRFVTVDLEKRSCDYRVFDLTGIPCPHALAAIYDRRQQPVDYVSDFYKREKYLTSYSFPLQALKGIDYWDYYDEEVLLPPDIPKKLRGKPKKLRRREEWEGGTQGNTDNTVEKVQRWSSKRVQHCSKCRKTGHRRTKCPDLQGESSPSETTGGPLVFTRKNLALKGQNYLLEEMLVVIRKFQPKPHRLLQLLTAIQCSFK